MNPVRFAVGAIAALAVSILFLGRDSTPETSEAPTASERPLVTVVLTKPPAITAPPATTTTSTTSTTTSTSTIPLPLVDPDTPCQEWIPLAVEQGWPADRDVTETLAWIMYRESRCTPTADSGPDHGLLQINRFWCEPSRYSPTGWLQERGVVSSCDDLFDPATNLHAGFLIYVHSLERNGDGFLPWTTYSGG